MKLSPTQLKVLAAIRFGQLRYYHYRETAFIDSDMAVVRISTVRALIRERLITPDEEDDTLWVVASAGHQLLRLEPETMEQAGRDHARSETQAIVSSIVNSARIANRTPETDATLQAEISRQLQETGTASAAVAELLVLVEAWRSLARAAAKELRRPVQTIVMGDWVHAVLRDWPANERESQIHEARKRAIVNAVTLPS